METNEKDKKELSVDERIKLRNSWLKIIIVITFLIVFLIKIIQSKFSLNFEKLNLNDILSVILAIFSICLSVAFYFKSCDSSNLFYDNTYKFTKDIAQILARIESGFGEKLDHLDEGYNSLNGLFSKEKIENKKEEIKDDTKEIDRITKERNELLTELANKAKLNEKERNEFLTKMESKDTEIQKLKRNIFFLQRQLEHSEKSPIHDFFQQLPYKVQKFLREDYVPQLFAEGYSADISERMQSRIINRVNNDMPKVFISDMKELGLFDINNNITTKGMSIIRYLA